ncbi:MAG: PorT family protein [Lentimicrobium sp.]|nr:PorT family protein [Lentimicrobium sp.]
MKQFLTFLAALLITGIATAQHGNTPAGFINIGIKGGLNYYNISNDNNLKYDNKLGYHIGLLGHIHINQSFAVQPEIVFSTQGAKYKVDNVTTNYNLSYINVPVLFQYMFDNGLRLQAGPQAGLLLAAKSKNGSTTIDNKENLKPLDLALSIGAGYIFPPSGLGIDLRYNLGLNNINDVGEVKSTNRGLQLGLFYIFGHTGSR